MENVNLAINTSKQDLTMIVKSQFLRNWRKIKDISELAGAPTVYIIQIYLPEPSFQSFTIGYVFPFEENLYIYIVIPILCIMYVSCDEPCFLSEG